MPGHGDVRKNHIMEGLEITMKQNEFIGSSEHEDKRQLKLQEDCRKGSEKIIDRTRQFRHLRHHLF